MKLVRKKRLQTVLLILATSALGSFFIIRGMVLENSVIREKTKISFIVSDYQGSINVEFDGIVPDLFKEGSGVVVLGYLKDKTIIAEEVLAKHDENYMPPRIDIEK